MLIRGAGWVRESQVRFWRLALRGAFQTPATMGDKGRDLYCQV